ncbi:MAG: hypothetical protein ACJAXT_001856 [Paracoccaceae bacterium]|jgi:hypothetical protein
MARRAVERPIGSCGKIANRDPQPQRLFGQLVLA